MNEIKKEIKQNADGSFTITDEHSTADIIRWLLTQDSKETILYLLKEESPQRTWVGLTGKEVAAIFTSVHTWHERAEAIEAKLKEKNHG